MVFFSSLPKRLYIPVLSIGLLASCIHKKYETPITKDTKQPDKILFDAAMHDIEKGRYEVARISLQTLMNTYESSEYLAKAKLAIADSWYREGGANGNAQAEAEYKDFELFYPSMPESAEAQNRICQIHFKQMDKSDRDWSQALRAEDECRAVLTNYPNSKFAPRAADELRQIQESLGEHEYVVGRFYYDRGANPAAANRLNALADQYPLYSKADDALYRAGDAYSRMGPRFRQKAGDMFARVARDYPLSSRLDDAKQRLQDMEMPVPAADPSAYARMKYEQENYRKPGMLAKSMGFIRSAPDVSHAAKSGNPTMTDPKHTIPGSVPVTDTATEQANTGGSGAGSSDVSLTQVNGANSALDNKPDARAGGGAAAPDKPADAQTSNAPLPTNRDEELKKIRERQAKLAAKKNRKNKNKTADQAAPASSGSSNAAPSDAVHSPQGNTVPNATAPNQPTSNPTSPNPANTAPPSPAPPQ